MNLKKTYYYTHSKVKVKMGQVLTKNDNQPVPRKFLLSEEYPYEGKSYNEIGAYHEW